MEDRPWKMSLEVREGWRCTVQRIAIDNGQGEQNQDPIEKTKQWVCSPTPAPCDTDGHRSWTFWHPSDTTTGSWQYNHQQCCARRRRRLKWKKKVVWNWVNCRVNGSKRFYGSPTVLRYGGQNWIPLKWASYHLVMTNSLPWTITMLLSSINHLFRLGPSIPWQTVSHNQRVRIANICGPLSLNLSSQITKECNRLNRFCSTCQL